MKQIPYCSLSIPDPREREELTARFSRILASGGYVLTDELSRFEERFAAFNRTGAAIGVNSGTDALYLVLKALGVGEGDEVITAANSFIATAGAIVQAGARPVFVDVSYDDMLMDADLLEAAITIRTRAIIPVHLTGLMCDMDRIVEIAGRRAIPVIEDAAQAIDAEYKGNKAGSLGIAGCYSFYPLKNIGTFGDGGMIVSSDEGIIAATRRLRNHGLADRDHAPVFGINSRLDVMHASFLDYRLSKIDAITAAKRNIADYYDSRLYPLKASGELSYCTGGAEKRHVFHLFVIKTPKRDDLQAYLAEKGIETRVHYPIPIHRQQAYIDRFGTVSLPVTERLADEMLSIPIWVDMAPEMRDAVADAILSFFSGSHSPSCH